MNYFLAPHERSYGDGTNLGTSYCQFLTRLPLAQCLIARSARGDVRWEAAYFVFARRRKSVSARSSSARRREHRGFDIVTNWGPQVQTLASSWRERANRRPSVTARRSAYASRGSVGL